MTHGLPFSIVPILGSYSVLSRLPQATLGVFPCNTSTTDCSRICSLDKNVNLIFFTCLLKIVVPFVIYHIHKWSSHDNFRIFSMLQSILNQVHTFSHISLQIDLTLCNSLNMSAGFIPPLKITGLWRKSISNRSFANSFGDMTPHSLKVITSSYISSPLMQSTLTLSLFFYTAENFLQVFLTDNFPSFFCYSCSTSST